MLFVENNTHLLFMTSEELVLKYKSLKLLQENRPTVEFVTSSTLQSNRNILQNKFSFPPLWVFITAVSFPLTAELLSPFWREKNSHLVVGTYSIAMYLCMDYIRYSTKVEFPRFQS